MLSIQNKIALILFLILVGCSNQENSYHTRFYGLLPNHEVNLIYKIERTGIAPKDTILNSNEDFILLPDHNDILNAITDTLNFNDYLYLFAYVKYSGSLSNVSMSFFTVDGESSCHVFHIYGESEAETNKYALFIWSIKRT